MFCDFICSVSKVNGIHFFYFILSVLQNCKETLLKSNGTDQKYAMESYSGPHVWVCTVDVLDFSVSYSHHTDWNKIDGYYRVCFYNLHFTDVLSALNIRCWDLGESTCLYIGFFLKFNHHLLCFFHSKTNSPLCCQGTQWCPPFARAGTGEEITKHPSC